MYMFLLVINIISAFAMVGVILLQQGQGAEMGSSFGRGAQGSLIGITGSANFLSRMTSVLALVFFSTALALAVVGKHEPTDQLLEELTAPAAQPGTQPESQAPATVSEVPDVAAPAAAGDQQGQ